MSTTTRIVVGVDGSDAGLRALRWAVAEAAAVGATVDAVAAFTVDALDANIAARILADRRAAIMTTLADTVEAVRAPFGGLKKNPVCGMMPE